MCSKCRASPRLINQRYCRQCSTAVSKSWQKRNPEKVRATRRRYRKRHKEQLRASKEVWLAKNPGYMRQWVEKNRHRLYGYRLRAVYKISGKQYADLLVSQGNVCAICKNPPNGRPLGVDHCHRTQEIRGLLCNQCNLAIGAFRDNRRLMTSAMNYLAQPRLALTHPSPKGDSP